MRIWLIAENWPPRVGGIERYLSGIASHLPKGSVTVFAPTETADGAHDESYVIRKRFFWKPLWPAWLPLFFFLKKLAQEEKPDVILCGKALMEGRIAYQLKKSLDIPYVVCTYGMEIATWSTSPRIRKQLVRVLTSAHAVLYINEQTKQELIALGVHEQNLFALYPGIDTEKLSRMSNTEEVLKKYNIKKPYVISVARLIKRKGIDDLLKAFGKENGVSLVVVGDGPEKKSLEMQAKKLETPALFVGHIPDEDVHALYNGAQAFALTPKELPGDYEGFGIVYLEAGFFELPVVGTNTGGVKEAVLDSKTGILANAGDSESISSALHKILKEPTLATEYGKAGRARVLEQFTWQSVIKTLENILHQHTS